MCSACFLEGFPELGEGGTGDAAVHTSFGAFAGDSPVWAGGLSPGTPRGGGGGCLRRGLPALGSWVRGSFRPSAPLGCTADAHRFRRARNLVRSGCVAAQSRLVPIQSVHLIWVCHHEVVKSLATRARMLSMCRLLQLTVEAS